MTALDNVTKKWNYCPIVGRKESAWWRDWHHSCGNDQANILSSKNRAHLLRARSVRFMLVIQYDFFALVNSNSKGRRRNFNCSCLASFLCVGGRGSPLNNTNELRVDIWISFTAARYHGRSLTLTDRPQCYVTHARKRPKGRGQESNKQKSDY